MIALALTLSLLAADGGNEPLRAVELVEVRAGENLRALAKRTLGDARAASELQAINALTNDRPRPGTKLKLPGPERALAASALNAARNAVAQAKTSAPKQKQAADRLKVAEMAFANARYADSARAADEAWRMLSATAEEPTRFAVNVDESGTTKVKPQSGSPVRVDARGVAVPVYVGQEAETKTNEAPRMTAERRMLDPVELVSPKDGAELKQSESGNAIAQRLTWKASPGAASYLVTVAPNRHGAKANTFKANGTSAVIPELPAGGYLWWVSAVLSNGAASSPSESRAFTLLDDPLKLEVGKGRWK